MLDDAMAPDQDRHCLLRLLGSLHENIPTNFDSLKPHFCIVKLEFNGVYIFFIFLLKKHRLWVLVRIEAVLTSTHNLCFEQKYEKKYQHFLSNNFHFLVVKISVYLNRHVFVMYTES